MKNKVSRIITFAVIVVLVHTSKAQNLYKEEAQTILQGMKEKKYEAFKDLLDPNVVVANLPTGMNDAIIPQVIKQLPVLEKYEIINSAQEGQNTRVKCEIINALGTKESPDFLFNQKGKVIEMNILGDKKAEVQKISSMTDKNTKFPDVMEIPFKVKGGLIFVEAEVNGLKGDFIFDSGAPILILNSAYFKDKDTLNTVAKKMSLV